MPPKVKISKQDIITAALDMVRQNGSAALNARSLASFLNCSTQPIFSNFANMEELRYAVIKKADELYSAYLTREIETQNYPPYKATGIAYIRFAKEEKELFKLLFMRDRADEKVDPISQSDSLVENVVHDSTGLDGDEAKIFHFRMWACVHGIATMVATGFMDLDWEFISQTLTATYIAAKNQNETEQNDVGC